MKSLPAAIVILGCAAFVHLRNYLSKDDYDNIYVSDLFRRIDLERSKVSGIAELLPLKRYERCFVVDTGTLALGRPEIGLWSDGLCIFVLHLLLSVVCCGFDFSLYWVLALVQRHSRPGFDVTGSDSLDLVVTGRGIIVDLLDIFLKGFHPGRWFSFTGDTQACLPVPRPPSLRRLCVLGGLYVLLLLSIVLKAYVLRLRDRITGFFYCQRQLERVSYLWRVLAAQRLQLPRLLHEMARANHRNDCATLPACYRKSAKTGCGQVFCARCLVCVSRVHQRSVRACERTRSCPGLYCPECYEDIERICPLCADETSEQRQTNKEGVAQDENIVHCTKEHKLCPERMTTYRE